ncbi:MAG TPA: GNAT family N-acetyltransferase [Solirubrobacteraceae bacterium]|nr:GNAT family N-acetyltransferase [Solirubrobacteraceae bacterium]
MSDAPRVWRAGPREANEVTRLLLEFRDWNEGAGPGEAEMRGSVKRLMVDPDTEFLLAAPAQPAAAAGVCQLRFRHSVWTSSDDCWLEDLFVEERARGKGLGRTLVLAAVERATARGARRIELDTSESNTSAIALYESLGFSATSKTHGPLRGRDLFMGRRL